jgi:hypothetical protein
LPIEVPGVGGGNLVLDAIELFLNPGHFLVAERFPKFHAQFFRPFQETAQGSNGLFDIFPNGFILSQPRLLADEADADSLRRPHASQEIFFFQGHDPQQCAFASAVVSQNADLGTGEEGQPNVFEDFPLAVSLGQVLDSEDVLLSHENLYDW